MKPDTSAIRYSLRHSIRYVYYDKDTGEIMQFIPKINRKEAEKKVEYMFPNRNMELVTLEEYAKLFKIEL